VVNPQVTGRGFEHHDNHHRWPWQSHPLRDNSLSVLGGWRSHQDPSHCQLQPPGRGSLWSKVPMAGKQRSRRRPCRHCSVTGGQRDIQSQATHNERRHLWTPCMELHTTDSGLLFIIKLKPADEASICLKHAHW